MAGLGSVKDLLLQIYGPQKGAQAFDRIASLIDRFGIKKEKKKAFFSEKDTVLITYADTLQRQGEAALETFGRFAAGYLKEAISAIHFLPFFPYSSDDGFSVMDFLSIDPKLGEWSAVARVEEDFELMFDFVINHFSAKGKWFENYLQGREGFCDFAIETDPAADLSQVTRPRSLPLLTPFEKKDGRTVHLWTTFSADQIDFNYRSLDVLAKMIEVLLFYVTKGARWIRLDAIAYLWKEIGTPCIHLPQTHAMVRLLRSILDLAAPDVVLITETNVPHAENIGYFGNGYNEAQLVYNFTLPPLLFYSFLKEDARALSRWARGLKAPSPATTFFNFSASHDGIGVRPLEGILPAVEIERLTAAVKANHGHVSLKSNPDGSQSPYELNITYLDAILTDSESQRAEKFLASQAIQYALPGVPATYIHSLLGSRNWTAGVAQTGRPRSINRQKLDIDTILDDLRDPASFRSRVFFPYRDLMEIRRKQPAFHPSAEFKILELDPGLFAIQRRTTGQTLYALTNVTSRPISVSLLECRASTLFDLISATVVDPRAIRLKPYQFAWLAEPAD
jgi:glycosidase